jgi:hypothetical protein
MRQFSIGETVTRVPDRYAAPGDYKIIAAMPDRDGDHMYRIKSPLEEYERVVGESLLVKSEGKRSEEIPKNRSRRRINHTAQGARSVKTSALLAKGQSSLLG